MKFRELAIEAHKKAEADSAYNRKCSAERFAEQATRALTAMTSFDGWVAVLDDEPKPPYTVKFLTQDGVFIKAQRQYDDPQFEVGIECQQCKLLVWHRFGSLADLGKWLSFEQDCCPQCDTGGQSVKRQTWRDRLADAIVEAIEEMLPA